MEEIDRQTYFKGHRFENRVEADRAKMLWEMNDRGEIGGLMFHPRLFLSPANIRYTPEFYYTEISTGRRIYEDFKAKRDPRFKDIVKLWRHYGPGVLRVTEFRHNHFRVIKEVDLQP